MRHYVIRGGALLVAFLFPLFVHAARLYLTPASGTFPVGSTITVQVRVNSEGEAVNTAEANIVFTGDTIQLVDVEGGDVFYLSAPGSPAKTATSAYFGGGLPTPGFTGTAGNLGTMTFRVVREGTASLSITNGKVLLNDGIGTNALSGTAGARFTITPPPVGAPAVTSVTHPNPEAWHTQTDVELSWNRPTGAYGFSYELDDKPDTVPDAALETTNETSRRYNDLADGVWFFHIRARRQAVGQFGLTTHFRIQIDTMQPRFFEITMIGQADLKDVTRTPTVAFEAKDDLSGIDHYDIFLDEQLTLSGVKAPYSFGKIQSGPHIIKVIAYDKASNSRTTALPVIITSPIDAQRIVSTPLYALVLVNIAIFISIIFVAWLLLHHHQQQLSRISDEVGDLQKDIDQSLTKMKVGISRRILNLLSRAPTKEFEEKVQHALTDVAAGVNAMEEKIDADMGDLKEATKGKTPDVTSRGDPRTPPRQ